MSDRLVEVHRHLHRLMGELECWDDAAAAVVLDRLKEIAGDQPPEPHLRERIFRKLVAADRDHQMRATTVRLHPVDHHDLAYSEGERARHGGVTRIARRAYPDRIHRARGDMSTVHYVEVCPFVLSTPVGPVQVLYDEEMVPGDIHVLFGPERLRIDLGRLRDRA